MCLLWWWYSEAYLSQGRMVLQKVLYMLPPCAMIYEKVRLNEFIESTYTALMKLSNACQGKGSLIKKHILSINREFHSEAEERNTRKMEYPVKKLTNYFII
ncbi:hypothetical protein HNY73_015065 [Argiope bruennichi]|uniref:Uncharacterized protein n=1 Tax=Argiope bruennichi TaxID=94029 RepID=A0A8T0ESW5_ARGBR|nr:hypothetical protein HNY73_015065 [Argiope bruennichi]